MKRIISPLFAAVLALFTLLAVAAPVNINTADSRTLATSLVGVGPKTAKAIVEYRTKNGPFKSIDELEKVKGVGPKLVDKNRANLSVK